MIRELRKKLKEIAKLVSGELIGDPELAIKGVSNIENAKEGDLAFALELKALKEAEESSASAVVTALNVKISKPSIQVSNPRLAMAKILAIFAPGAEIEVGIHKTAIISPSTKVGKDVTIGAFVVVGKNARIGSRVIIYPGCYIGDSSTIDDDSILYPRVTVYPRVEIGKRVIIHSGAVLGMDGYGFVGVEGRHEKIPQIGKVIIEDDVEIYSNTCIARGTMGTTRIGRGTKIDNLTHIAHNCVIGEDCAITSLVGFAGSVKLGNHVSVGGQAGFSGHINVGDNTVVMGKAGVTKDIPKNSVISGFPAQDHKKEMEMQALLHRLPELFKRVADLEKQFKL